MRTYIMAGGVAAAVILAVVAFIMFAPQKSTDAKEAKVRATFSADGVITKDKPDLRKGGWYFDYEKDGQMVTAPILFSEISVCAWLDSSGKCKPSTFIKGRKAHIEGMDLGEGAIGVVRLTWSEAPNR
ncbi:hypothetical protein HY969_04480 [Candidatus Kaiserbacteria bacterium]|nr:hypothetical protein [Candidatus Kaiserbacteria bacterium]